ncbi:methionyl-tRNA formyltransferase [Corynebacterium sp. 13CS0277]|uniref:methionyl-tRNA formyltransferase n=1 Tax=Corynebacterium sp. 13CS0277 TaxID=2071994 RepID=UPI000D039396|nr:methionyl-tRNA formyltransferase [Corynebacterium sp. 13CS0277]PRQ11934.1 methionyl-tRNA formyltransferase [Corynebacterium sp. 13CS0277]
MRLVFAGTPAPAAAVLEQLIASEHTVEAVITRPDARQGRGRTLHPSAVAQVAEAHGIEVLKASRLAADDEQGALVRARLAEIAPDCIPVVAYGALVPADLLDAAPHGWVNLHFSLLPQWRGAAPVQAAIAAGQESTGVTVFRIDEGLDTGPVLSRCEAPIAAQDTAASLLERLAAVGGELMVDTFTRAERGEITPQPQVGEGTYAHKISTEFARVDFSQPAEVVDCRIRAVTPAPGAWCELEGQRVKLGPVTPVAPVSAAGDPVDLAPGQLLAEKKRVLVGTGAGVVALGTIQLPGKKMIPAADWGRNLSLAEGAVRCGDTDYPSRSFQ